MGMFMIGFLKQKIREKKFRKKWRKKNANNRTKPIGIFNLDIVSIGKFTYGPINVLAWGNSNEKLVIGDFCSIAKGVQFNLGGNHFFSYLSNYPFSYYFTGKVKPASTNGPIIIKDGVWIGTDALILSGVTIGKGSIIGARAVVAKDIPPFAIVAGNPGKIIRYRFNKETRKRLEKIDYYKFIDQEFYEKYQDLLHLPLNENFIKILEKYSVSK